MQTRKFWLHFTVFAIILAFLSGCGATPPATPTPEPTAAVTVDFTGHWEALSLPFTLDLVQAVDKVQGTHSVVAQEGAKIDSLEKSITGAIQGQTATVEFQSSFSANPGKAEITFIDEKTLFWKVTSAPDGENYFPATATLVKKALATPAPAKSATLTGSLHLVAPPLPRMVVYAVEPTTGLWETVETEAAESGAATFSLAVAPGSYQLFAAVADGTTVSAGYSTDGLTLTTVSVADGQTVTGLEIRPPSQAECGASMGYPASPDGRFAALPAPAADCATATPQAGAASTVGTLSGQVFLQGPPTPHMVVYAADQTTGVWAYVETQATNGEAPFSLELAPGTYRLFAFADNGGYAAYTQDQVTLTPITVTAGQTLNGLRVGPPGQSDCGALFGVPAAPDGRFAAVAGPKAECLATLPNLGVTRIQFQPGAVSAQTSGTLVPNTTVRYVISALKGQLLTVQLTTSLDAAPAPAASLTIRGADGQVYTSELTTKWHGALLASQDYFIEVTSLSAQGLNYGLLVAIPAIGSTPYVPVTPSVCQTLQELAAQAVPATYTLEASVPFIDPITGEAGQSCNLTAKGTGKDFPAPAQIVNKLVSGFSGFTENSQYGFGGPTGMGTAVTRDSALVLISANWMPAISCPSDQPIGSCVLTPEQKLYTIKIQATMK